MFNFEQNTLLETEQQLIDLNWTPKVRRWAADDSFIVGCGDFRRRGKRSLLTRFSSNWRQPSFLRWLAGVFRELMTDHYSVLLAASVLFLAALFGSILDSIKKMIVVSPFQ